MAAGGSMDGPDRPAGEVLQRRFAEQVAELLGCEEAARTGDADAVHRTRIACGRLRCALMTYRPLVDSSVTEPLRDELGWLRTLLGAVRDAQVAHVRLRSLVEEEPATAATSAMLHRLDHSYAERARTASAALAEALDGDRYRELGAALSRLVEDPPWTPLAKQAPGEVLPRRVRRAWRRLDRRMGAVASAADADEALHQVRREAKRVRYAAETLVPVWGDDARRLARATSRLTAHLGERQDTVVSRRDLVVLAAESDAAGEDPTVWRLLATREAQHAAALDRDLPDVWAALSGKKLRRWLR